MLGNRLKERGCRGLEGTTQLSQRQEEGDDLVAKDLGIP